MEYIKKEDLISALIAEGYIKSFEKIERIKPGHGSCCTCQDCGRYHDDCVCGHNSWIDFVNNLPISK